MRIAVADDEEFLLRHLENTVRAALPGSEVCAFGLSAQLLEAAKNKVFDIVFLDIQMPGLNGIELARELKKTNERLNIIFTTGYDGYQGEAMELFASGYIKKPVTGEKVELQLKNLRYPVAPEKRIRARTFGNFTLFVDGTPVAFSREKVQMATAYLIHCRGSFVSKKELSCILFDDGVYDANRRSYISKLCSEIQSFFDGFGLSDFILKTPGALAVNLGMLDCDLYDYTDGKAGSGEKFCGEYINQYAFGEEMIDLLNKKRK